MELAVNISSISLRQKPEEDFGIMSNIVLKAWDGGYSRRTNGSGDLKSGLQDIYLPCVSDADVNRSFISLLPPPGADLMAVWILMPLAYDDPLKEVSASQLMAMHQSEMSRVLAQDKSFRSYCAETKNPKPAFGLAGAAHFGVASFSLLLAAILLTQLFRRRTYAFAGVLAIVILYAAAMDRVVLGMNVSHLKDSSAPLVVRTTACRQTAMSFFYGKTALCEIQAVASDKTAPAGLSQCAQRTAEEMTATAR